MAPDDNKSGLTSRHLPWILLGVLILFSLVMFRAVLLPGNILFTTDDGIGAMAIKKHAMPYGFLGWWDDSILMGVSYVLNINWTDAWLWLLPLDFFVNWIHAIDLVAASIFLSLFLRRRGLSWPAVGLAVVTAFWLGSNFTLTYAGHTGKFGLLVFAAAYLWLSDRAVETRSIAWSSLAGGSLGLMFLEQADLALLCALFLVPYTLVTLLIAHPRDVRGMSRVIIPLGALAALVAFHALWSGYQSSVKQVTNVSGEDPRAQWEFATQWSWPPEESIDFVAPGYMGWRSGENKGPYWGRMGRSAGWETTKQGFQNFKLENHYLGLVPVALAIWALVLIRSRGALDKGRRRQLILWGSITALALFLSFGKYFLLYRLIYALPGISSIRNPNKFLHLFQMGLGILAAYGLDEALRAPDATKRLRHVLLALAFGFFLWGLGTFSSAPSAVRILTAQGFNAVAQIIVENKAFALLHAAVMAAALAVFLYVHGKRSASAALPWSLVLLVALDAFYLSRNYVNTMRADSVQETDVIRVMKSAGPNGRAALADQGGFYNYWLTYLFPYHNVPMFNFTQMPRMPADYQALLSAAGRNPIRMWQVAAVRHIAGPSQIWGQVQSDANLKDQFAIKYAFNVTSADGADIKVVAATEKQPGQHCILEFKNAPPRYYLAGRWRAATDQAALDKLRNPGIPMLDEVLVEFDGALPTSDAEAGSAGEVTIRDYHPGRIVLGASVNRPAILRVAERYTPEWKATVDGEPTRLLRCDFIMQGVLLEPGLHEVVLRYAPARWSLGVQLVGFLLILSALPFVIAWPRREGAV